MNSDKTVTFEFRGHQYPVKSYLAGLKRLSRAIKKTNVKKLDEKGLENLLDGFYKSVRRMGGSYNPLVLHTVLRKLGPEDYFLTASTLPFEGSENKFPERVLPYNEEGQRREVNVIEQIWDFEDLANVYAHFSQGYL
jgi:hypothetical protein